MPQQIWGIDDGRLTCLLQFAKYIWATRHSAHVNYVLESLS